VAGPLGAAASVSLVSLGGGLGRVVGVEVGSEGTIVWRRTDEQGRGFGVDGVVVRGRRIVWGFVWGFIWGRDAIYGGGACGRRARAAWRGLTVLVGRARRAGRAGRAVPRERRSWRAVMAHGALREEGKPEAARMARGSRDRSGGWNVERRAHDALVSSAAAATYLKLLLPGRHDTTHIGQHVLCASTPCTSHPSCLRIQLLVCSCSPRRARGARRLRRPAPRSMPPKMVREA
jgi:hypothetical protein